MAEELKIVLEKLEAQLIELMRDIPALEEEQNRNNLLQNLPQKPIAAINRSLDNKDADIRIIITHTKQFGWLQNGNHALEIVIDNAKEFVEGLVYGQKLETIKKELISILKDEKDYEASETSDKKEFQQASQEEYQEEPFSFINREYEIKELIGPNCPQFVVFDAAACYGKTFLLKEAQKLINERIEEKNERTLCLYIDFKEVKDKIQNQKNNRRYLLEEILNELETSLNCYTHGDSQTDEEELLFSIITNLSDPENDLYRVIFIFDSLEIIQTNNELTREDNFKEYRRWFWNEFIVDLSKLLSDSPQRIIFQGIFAGRYIRHEFKGKWRRLTRIRPLVPFDTHVIQTVIENYMRKNNLKALYPDKSLKIAQEVFDLTGGHTKCIIQILKEIEKRRFAIVVGDEKHRLYFFNDKRKKEFIEYVKNALNVILRDVDYEVQQVLEWISVFRCFNMDTLDLLTKEGYISISDFPTRTSLLIGIMKTHLIKGPTLDNPMYKGNTVRLMLASYLKNKDKTNYSKLNMIACRLYKKWVRGKSYYKEEPLERVSDDFRLRCIAEALYHHAEKIHLKKLDLAKSRKTLTGTFKVLLKSLEDIPPNFLQQDIIPRIYYMINEETDSDLVDKIIRVSGEDGYENLIDTLDNFSHHLSE